MFKGDVYKGVVKNDKASTFKILIDLGSNSFVEAANVRSNFDLFKLRHTKSSDFRVIPMISDKQKGIGQYIEDDMVEPYFELSDTFKVISLKKVKKLR